MELDLSRNVNTVTYCMVCGSALYWDEQGVPAIIRVGDDNLISCLQTGCTLVYASTQHSTGNFDLFRMNLVEAGIPPDIAMSIAAIVAMQTATSRAA